MRDWKTGFVDVRGRIVLDPVYDEIRPFYEGLAIVRRGRNYGCVDLRGRIVLQPKFPPLERFGDGLAAVTIKRKLGYIDRSGKVVIEPRYERARPFREGLAAVTLDACEDANSVRYGFIDKSGRLLIEPRFRDTNGFSDGLAGVELASGWGFIDRTGKMAIPARFAKVKDFREGLAPVLEISESHEDYLLYLELLGGTDEQPRKRFVGKWGFIDRKGRFAIPPRLDYAWEFGAGRACVFHKNKRYYVDAKGRLYPSRDSHDPVGQVKEQPSAPPAGRWP